MHYLITKNIDSDEHPSDQEDAGLCDEHSIGPETIHRHWSFSHNVRLAESSHENAIGDERDDAGDLDIGELHEHIDSVAEDYHDGDHENSIGADSFQEEQSEKSEDEAEEDSS